jgi:hypothetical protein
MLQQGVSQKAEDMEKSIEALTKWLKTIWLKSQQ